MVTTRAEDPCALPSPQNPSRFSPRYHEILRRHRHGTEPPGRGAAETLPCPAQCPGLNERGAMISAAHTGPRRNRCNRRRASRVHLRVSISSRRRCRPVDIVEYAFRTTHFRVAFTFHLHCLNVRARCRRCRTNKPSLPLRVPATGSHSVNSAVGRRPVLPLLGQAFSARTPPSRPARARFPAGGCTWQSARNGRQSRSLSVRRPWPPRSRP
jgi:hypothetical protein